MDNISGLIIIGLGCFAVWFYVYYLRLKKTKIGSVGGKKIKIVNGKLTVPFRITIYEEKNDALEGQWFRLSKWENQGFIVMKSSWSRDWRILANKVPVVGVSFENRDVAFLSIGDKPGFRISLEPDPSNKYDKNAIKVMGEATVSGNVIRKQLGFLSKEMSKLLKGQEIDARPYSAGLPHGDSPYYLTITILERSKAFLKKQKAKA